MYGHCVYHAMSKKSKRTAKLPEKSRNFALIIFNGALYHVIAYTATFFEHRFT